MSKADHLRLLFVVGLTGVGKSTLLQALLTNDQGLRLLPNRREITDQTIIPEIQCLEGRTRQTVQDRLERFRLTARYRKRHPAGMVHALQCYLASQHLEGEGVFDNLRGLNEVRSAHQTFDAARFLVLDAPPLTRLERLVRRRDAFDQAASPAPVAADFATQIASIDGLSEVFDSVELSVLAERRKLLTDDLLRAARIIVTEQRHYDSHAARRYLEMHLPPERRLVIDTAELNEAEVERCAYTWLENA